MLALRAHAPAHTDHDLSVLDATTGTLWAGDLLFVGRIPSLDGSLAGWLHELDALRAVPAARAVPGHGPPAVPWPAAAADLTRYLLALRDGTRAAIAAGIGIAEAPGPRCAGGSRPLAAGRGLSRPQRHRRLPRIGMGVAAMRLALPRRPLLLAGLAAPAAARAQGIEPADTPRRATRWRDLKQAIFGDRPTEPAGEALDLSVPAAGAGRGAGAGRPRPSRRSWRRGSWRSTW